MNITSPKPLSSESLSKSTVRSISGLSRTKDVKLTDVTNDDEDGEMMMDDVPVKTMTTQNISAFLLASNINMLGLMCGVIGASVIDFERG